MNFLYHAVFYKIMYTVFSVMVFGLHDWPAQKGEGALLCFDSI